MSWITELRQLYCAHTSGENVNGASLAKDLYTFIEAHEDDTDASLEKLSQSRDELRAKWETQRELIRDQENAIKSLKAERDANHEIADAALEQARVAEESLATVVEQREEWRNRYFDVCEIVNDNARMWLGAEKQRIAHCEALVKFRREGKLSDEDVRAAGLETV